MTIGYLSLLDLNFPVIFLTGTADSNLPDRNILWSECPKEGGGEGESRGCLWWNSLIVPWRIVVIRIMVLQFV